MPLSPDNGAYSSDVEDYKETDTEKEEVKKGLKKKSNKKQKHSMSSTIVIAVFAVSLVLGIIAIQKTDNSSTNTDRVNLKQVAKTAKEQTIAHAEDGKCRKWPIILYAYACCCGLAACTEPIMKCNKGRSAYEIVVSIFIWIPHTIELLFVGPAFAVLLPTFFCCKNSCCCECCEHAPRVFMAWATWVLDFCGVCNNGFWDVSLWVPNMADYDVDAKEMRKVRDRLGFWEEQGICGSPGEFEESYLTMDRMFAYWAEEAHKHKDNGKYKEVEHSRSLAEAYQAAIQAEHDFLDKMKTLKDATAPNETQNASDPLASQVEERWRRASGDHSDSLQWQNRAVSGNEYLDELIKRNSDRLFLYRPASNFVANGTVAAAQAAAANTNGGATATAAASNEGSTKASAISKYVEEALGDDGVFKSKLGGDKLFEEFVEKSLSDSSAQNLVTSNTHNWNQASAKEAMEDINKLVIAQIIPKTEVPAAERSNDTAEGSIPADGTITNGARGRGTVSDGGAARSDGGVRNGGSADNRRSTVDARGAAQSA